MRPSTRHPTRGLRFTFASALLAALLVTTPGLAAGGRMRYTLAVTYNGSYIQQSVTPFVIGGVEGVEWSSWRESTSYVARSVRPFVLTRDGAPFRATMTGSFSHIASGAKGASGVLGGDLVWREQRWSFTDSGAGGVRGHVASTRRGRSSIEVAIGYLSNTIDHRGEYWGQPGNDHRVWTSTDNGTTTYPGTRTARVDLRKRWGRAFTIGARNDNPDYSPGGKIRGRFTLRFTPVAQEEERERERWRVEVRGRDSWTWGAYTGLGAGVWVDWAHRTTLEIKDGRLIAATGIVHVLGVTPFSDPPGAFSVGSFSATAPPAYAVPKASKSGDRVELGLLKPDRSEYRVDYTVQALAGERLLEALRAIGVADPQKTHDSLVARGPITDTAVPITPHDTRVVVRLREDRFNRLTPAGFNPQLPCTTFGAAEKDCFLTRGGETVTVTKLP